MLLRKLLLLLLLRMRRLLLLLLRRLLLLLGRGSRVAGRGSRLRCAALRCAALRCAALRLWLAAAGCLGVPSLARPARQVSAAGLL